MQGKHDNANRDERRATSGDLDATQTIIIMLRKNAASGGSPKQREDFSKLTSPQQLDYIDAGVVMKREDCIPRFPKFWMDQTERSPDRPAPQPQTEVHTAVGTEEEDESNPMLGCGLY